MSEGLLLLAIVSFVVSFTAKDTARRNTARICGTIYLVGACIVI